MTILYPKNAQDGDVHFELQNDKYYMFNASLGKWVIIDDYPSKNIFVTNLYSSLLDQEIKNDNEDFIYWIRYISDTSDLSFLNQCYELFFERPPTQVEYDEYLITLAETGDRKSVISSILDTDEYNNLKLDDLDYSKDLDFIVGLYRKLLNREPNSSEKNVWYTNLTYKNFNRKTVVLDFLNSKEFNSIPNVNLIYGKTSKLLRMLAVIQFLYTEEYLGFYKTDELFINSLYEKVLNRSPEESSLNYWKDELSKGNYSKIDVIGEFLHSSEFKKGGTLLYELIHDNYKDYSDHVSSQKTSYIISSQVPQFVRDDHETFVNFLEEYYKFIERRFNVGNITKNYTDYLDVDNAEGDFLQKLYDNFIALIPANILADKKMILKHAKEFYRSRGTEKSVRYLMRLLFNKEVDIYYPKRDVLKASDGKWYVEKSLRLRNLKVNGVSNSDISVWNYFASKQIYGATSNAVAGVESVERYYDNGAVINELKLSGLTKQFREGETIFTEFDENGTAKSLSAELYSGVITSVTIAKKGSGYVEGTTIPLSSNTGSGAQIVISKTSRASILGIIPVRQGAGFKVNNSVLISGGNGTGAKANVLLVRDDSYYHPNSYDIVASTIDLEANTPINASQYANLNPSLVNPYLYSIKLSMGFWTYANTGPIKEILVINPGSNYSTFPDTVKVIANSQISSLGILGRMDIINGGTGYNVNDLIVFDNPVGSYGAGGLAKVTKVDEDKSNTITEVHFIEMEGHIIGGSGYTQDRLPIANVISSTGSGANILVTAVLGDGDKHVIANTSLIGGIEEVTIISGGKGYTEVPTLNLSNLGDGTAQVFATVVTGEYSYPGRYLNDDGQLSSYNFIQNKDYYQDYSYVVNIDEPINSWRKPLMELVHPAGMKVFNEYPTVDKASEEVITTANSHDYIFNKGTYSTNSVGLIVVDDFITNLHLSTANGCLDSKVLYLDQWPANSNVWFDDSGFYYAKVYEYESQIIGSDERSNTVILRDNVPGQISNLPLRIIQKANICNVTITRTNHGLNTGDSVFLQFLPKYQQERKNIIVSFVTSQEYYGKHGSSETAYVKSLYKNLLYREGEKAGLDFWISNLHNGTYTRSNVAVYFVNSTEFNFNYTAYTLLYETDNGEFVSTMYQRYLGRNPEEEGYNYWIEQLTPTANNLRSGIFTVQNKISSSQFVTINNNTADHTGNVMIAKA